MPTSTVKKTTLGLVLFGSLAAATFIFFDYSISSTTKINSSLKAKPPLLQSGFSSKGVSNRILKVKIITEAADSDEESVEVIAEISTPFDFNEKLSYKWKFGQDVNLVEGTAAGELPRLSKDGVNKVSIKIKGFNKEKNRHLGFEISGQLNGRRVHGDALVASDMENTFESIVQNVERIKASQ